jgi:hypothetical protein
VAQLALQRLAQAHLRHAGRHHVGHHLRFCHRGGNGGMVVAEAEHAVAAVVVQHRALERHYPRPAGGGGQIRIDRVVGIEIDEAGLRLRQLIDFVQLQKVFHTGCGHLRAQFAMTRHRLGDRPHQKGIDRGHALNAGVVQAGGPRLAAEIAQFAQLFNHTHDASPHPVGASLRTQSRPPGFSMLDSAWASGVLHRCGGACPALCCGP